MAKTNDSKKKGFSREEVAAMKEYMAELNANKGDGEALTLAAIAKMPEPDRTMAKKVHALILSSAPILSPRTWYGMPAYFKEDKVICFFQNASKFKARYSTLGFSDKAKLDEGEMWATSYALIKLTPSEEKKIATLLKKAVN